MARRQIRHKGMSARELRDQRKRLFRRAVLKRTGKSLPGRQKRAGKNLPELNAKTVLAELVVNAARGDPEKSRRRGLVTVRAFESRLKQHLFAAIEAP